MACQALIPRIFDVQAKEKRQRQDQLHRSLYTITKAVQHFHTGEDPSIRALLRTNLFSNLLIEVSCNLLILKLTRLSRSCRILII